MIVKFYRKNADGKNERVKTLNLLEVPKKGDKVKLYHTIYIVRDVCLDLDKVEYTIQL